MFTFYAASEAWKGSTSFFIQSCCVVVEWRKKGLKFIIFISSRRILRGNKKTNYCNWMELELTSVKCLTLLFDIKIYFHIKMAADHTWLLKYSWWFACLGYPWIKNDCEWWWWGLERYFLLLSCSHFYTAYIGLNSAGVWMKSCKTVFKYPSIGICKNIFYGLWFSVSISFRSAIWIKYDFWIRNQSSAK